MSTAGDTMMSVNDIMNIPGFHTNSMVLSMSFPTLIMVSSRRTRDILRCAEHPPMYCTDIVQGALSLFFTIFVVLGGLLSL